MAVTDRRSVTVCDGVCDAGQATETAKKTLATGETAWVTSLHVPLVSCQGTCRSSPPRIPDFSRRDARGTLETASYYGDPNLDPDGFPSSWGTSRCPHTRHLLPLH